MKRISNLIAITFLFVIVQAFYVKCNGQALEKDTIKINVERILIALPYPNFSSKDSGIVVINVLIDRNGAIIKAEPDLMLTKVTNEKLVTNSIKAAYKARFNAIMIDTIQRSNITYRFTLQ